MGRLSTITLALMLALTSSQGLADDQDNALRLKESGQILPLEKILDISRKEVDGKVLEVELERKRGQLIYELEILDNNGQVWELKVNASNGKIIEVERD